MCVLLPRMGDSGNCDSLQSVADFHKRAKSILPKGAYGYFALGAGDEETLVENKRAFSRYLLRWRCLRGVSDVDMHTSLLGCNVSSPICVAPSAMQKLACPEGELAMAGACADAGVLMTVSSFSNCSLEEVADLARAQGTPLWQQLYICRNREFTRQMVKKAEASGYKALVVTVDLPCNGIRRSTARDNFQMPPHLTLPNYESVRGTMGDKPGDGIDRTASLLIDPKLTWSDLTWLKSVTSMPIVAKGIMSPEDAEQALKHGASAIWVSNHGARQLDTTAATIEVLSDVVQSVAGRAEVYVDGGIESGTDALKALALGARAVFVGRAPIWGLACNGRSGALRVLKNLKTELEIALTLCGCSSVKGIPSSIVVPAARYRSCL